MVVQPYLFFEGRCEEALDFYRQALGAKVGMMMRNREAPDQPPPGMLPPGSEDKIMHAAFKVGDATLMASDGRCSGQPDFRGVYLSLSVTSEAEADRIFGALAEGGQVHMPLGETFFARRFGMVADRFGLGWMVNLAP